MEVKTMWFFSINVFTCWNDTTMAAKWCYQFHMLFSVLFSMDPSPIIKHRLTSTLDGRYILVSESSICTTEGQRPNMFFGTNPRTLIRNKILKRGRHLLGGLIFFMSQKVWHLWYSNFSFMDVSLSGLTPRIWKCLSMSSICYILFSFLSLHLHFNGKLKEADY